MITNRVDINQVLMQMHALKAETGNTGVQDIAPSQGINPHQQIDKTNPVNFSDMMTQAIDHVNATQKTSSQIATAFEMGYLQCGMSRAEAELLCKLR